MGARSLEALILDARGTSWAGNRSHLKLRQTVGRTIQAAHPIASWHNHDLPNGCPP